MKRAVVKVVVGVLAVVGQRGLLLNKAPAVVGLLARVETLAQVETATPD
jgi:hypothetical protein